MDSVIRVVWIWTLSKSWAKPRAGQTRSPRTADVMRFMIILSGSRGGPTLSRVRPLADQRYSRARPGVAPAAFLLREAPADP